MTETAKQGVLKWFGHVKMMSEERLIMRLHVSEVEKAREGEPRRWKDGVKEALSYWNLNM